MAHSLKPFSLLCGVALAALALPAYAQRTGPVDYRSLTDCPAGTLVYSASSGLFPCLPSLGVGQGGTGNTGGTSGGIPYYSSPTTLGSTAALTNNALMLGGGPGQPPRVTGSLGSIHSVLHGNPAAGPSFSPVDVTSEITGIVPTANLPSNGKIIDLRDVTATPCDGTTDMTTAIQNGINAASGNRMFYLPKYAGGACVVTNTISIPSYTRVIIDGTLMLGPAVNKWLLGVTANATNVEVGGYGILDGNSANNTGGGLSACFGTLGAASSNVWLHNLTIQNCKNWPMNFVGTTNAWATDLILQNSGNSPEFASGTNHCHARGLQISGIGDESFAFYGGVFMCSIEDSIIENLKTTGIGNVDGIAILNDTSQPAPLHDLLIRGNIIHGMGQSGIAINQGTGGGGDSYNIIVANNEIFQNGRNNLSGYCGIKMIGPDNVLITGNYLHEDGNPTTPSACYGVYASGVSHDIKISNNLILNEGQGGTLGVGVSMGANCTNCIVSDNQIGDNQTTKTMAFGIDGNAGPGAQILMNAIYGVVSGNPYNIAFASDTIVEVPRALGFRGVTSPVGGASITAFNINNLISIQNTGTLASFTVTAPGAPSAHQQITVMCDNTITTLTFAANTGQTVTGGSTTCGPGISHTWVLTTAAGVTWKQIN